MRDAIDLNDPSYTPARLFDETAWVLRAANRAELALLLEIDLGLMSRIENRKSPLTANVMVQIMDRTGWRIQYLRKLAGIAYDGMVYPPRPRVVGARGAARNYHIAKDDILQSMPGTVEQLIAKSGYARSTVEYWLKVLREGDPDTRASHIIDWIPASGAGAHAPVHQAGPGADMPRVPRGRVRERKSRAGWRARKAEAALVAC